MSNGPTISLLWPADNPGVTAHLTMLQSIITRLANNSASCKTWCLTLVGALVSLAGATHVPGIITFTLVPITIFGFLDTMYLAQEKAYRGLYNAVVTKIRNATYQLGDAFDAKAALELKYVGQAIKSWAIWPVYLGLIAAYLAAHFAGWLHVLTASAK